MGAISALQKTSGAQHARRADVWISASLLGSLCMLGTVLIWGMQSVVMRLSARQGLTVADMTVLRYGLAALLLIPIAWRRGRFPVGSIGWKRGVSLALLAGAPYNFLIVTGASYAPAVDGASILFAVTPLVTAPLAYFFAKERITRVKAIALGLILAGVLPFAIQSIVLGLRAGTQVWRGHVLFAIAGCLMSVIGTLSRRWKVDPWSFTTTVAILSALTIPLWVIELPTHLLEVDPSIAAFQAVYMGLFVGVASVVLYQKAITLLGPTMVGMFLALVPFVAWLGGELVLAEKPSLMEAVGMCLVVLGLAIAPMGSARIKCLIRPKPQRALP